jgi:hypothetical protein
MASLQVLRPQRHLPDLQVHLNAEQRGVGDLAQLVVR